MRTGGLQRARGMVSTHPLAVDAGVAVALAVYTGAWGSQYAPAGSRSFDLPALLLTAAANLPVALRRRAPFTVLLVCSSGALAFVAKGYWASLNGMGVLLAMYSVAAHRPPRVAAAAAAITFAVLEAGLMPPPSGPAWTLAAQSLTLTVLPWVFGNGTRLLHERAVRLEELSRQLASEQEARARQAVLDERVRIARELHDVVAHHMSVISVQAGLAGYVFDADPGTARQALRTVEETSHEALEETRRLLTVLRPDTAEVPDGGGPSPDHPAPDEPDRDDVSAAVGERAPTPGLDRVPGLVERIRAAGVPVRLSISGEPRPLPPGIELCAYRVVQEALTNVLRHARPATATVEVEYRGQHLAVQVIDDGPPRPDRSHAVSGRGLLGMHERARLYNGTLSAGPATEGGFAVRLLLPAPLPAGSHPEPLREVHGD